MAGYPATEIRIPANEAELERNCVILFQAVLNSPNQTRVGTRGQKQHGLDIVGFRNGDPNKLVGVQCKLKTGRSKLTKKEVLEEVTKALRHRPPVTEYFVVTTSKNDTKLTQLALELTQKQAAAGRAIEIVVWGWDTLQEKINLDHSAKQAFDPGWSPSVSAVEAKLDEVLQAQRKVGSKRRVAALSRELNIATPSTEAKFPREFADRELNAELIRAMKRRGFAKTDSPKEFADLAKRAADGDLSFGSAKLRAEILDRATRANAAPKTRALAVKFREASAKLDSTRDFFIADALLHEANGKPDETLRQLRARSDVEARSALLTALVRQKVSVIKCFETDGGVNYRSDRLI
jgi:hypothetical protein